MHQGQTGVERGQISPGPLRAWNLPQEQEG